jgi:subtilase family serine protease
LAPPETGCDPNTDFAVATGGSRAIAVVDAYHNPYAVSDFQTYSTQFGLPLSGLSVVYAGGTQPTVDPSGGWGLESALDVEISHAMAPNAKIYLVEAASNQTSDLLQAELVAANLVAKAGGGEVSNSWGGTEFTGQVAYDRYFTKAGVVYFASTGDSPGVSWPATSANVVAAGGTTTSRNPNTGAFVSEATWSEAGGGKSQVTVRPSYQAGVAATVGNRRGIPDMAFDANPDTPVWVYFSGSVSGYQGGWWSVGGTSVAAPALAGIVNAAGTFRTSSNAELTALYGGLGGPSFYDVIRGICGPYGGYSARAGWDFCTGVGSPRGLTGE